MTLRAFRGKSPLVPSSCFVEDSAQLIGDVELGEEASVWFNAVLRGDGGGATQRRTAASVFVGPGRPPSGISASEPIFFSAMFVPACHAVPVNLVSLENSVTRWASAS